MVTLLFRWAVGSTVLTRCQHGQEPKLAKLGSGQSGARATGIQKREPQVTPLFFGGPHSRKKPLSAPLLWAHYRMMVTEAPAVFAYLKLPLGRLGGAGRRPGARVDALPISYGWVY
jgi:hypothetical protein